MEREIKILQLCRQISQAGRYYAQVGYSGHVDGVDVYVYKATPSKLMKSDNIVYNVGYYIHGQYGDSPDGIVEKLEALLEESLCNQATK